MTMRGETTRRGFLAALGVGAAALAVPVGAMAASTSGPAGLEALRGWYRREIEKLAEELRPRFEAGELRAYRDSDFDDEDGPAWRDSDDQPKHLIEAACGRHFGLGKFVEGEFTLGHPRFFEGDEAAAYLVLALSPHAPFMDTAPIHPGLVARDAAAWDVIAVARARGYYVPAADEQKDPAQEVLS